MSSCKARKQLMRRTILPLLLILMLSACTSTDMVIL